MKKIGKNMEKGGMLLEAIAVLGLVAVSAPAVYKKNIARTEEIRDMTKASQLRVLKDAASQYIEKQYEGIIRSAAREDGKNEWQMAKDGNLVVKKEPLKVSDLKAYLPAGYVPDENVKIYLTARPDSTRNNRPQGLVSAIVVDSEDVTDTRGNRIARMIGAEGGYSSGGNLYGSRGVWSMSSDVIGSTVPENRVVVSSTYSKNLSSADYIYRNKVEGYPEANMMYTDVDMNGNSIEYIGRLAMRYNNGDKWADPHISKGPDDPIPEGSTGGAERDKGLSLLVHGERGEIVGKTRSQAKEKAYSWWGKDRDEKGEISVAADSSTLTDTSHFNDKTTLELSVGGPTRSAEEQDGYLRLRAAGENVACTRIESNYNMPKRGTVSGLTGGGAFIACANAADTSTYQKVSDEDKNGGAMGLPTASLVADDTSGTDDKGGSGYMIVTNPNNNRKAIMYGNYGTSFFNSNKDAYSGSAMELITGDGDEKVAAVVASGLAKNNSGAKDEIMTGFGDKKANNHGESSVANLYDVNNATAADDKLKVQFRADDNGGYLYLKDNVNASVPTVAVSGSDNDDADRTYSVVTRDGDNGYAKMQAGYHENGTSNAGAFIVRNNAEENGVDVAVLTDSAGGDGVVGASSFDPEVSSPAGSEGVRSGLFILKDDGHDRFRAKAENGGAVYMGNSDNNEILSSQVSQNRTIAIESKDKDKNAGSINVTTGINSAGAKIISLHENDGAGMRLSDHQGKETAMLSADSKGDSSSHKGGALVLNRFASDASAAASKAELLTGLDDSRNNGLATANGGGTLVMSDGGKRNIIVTARGPSSGGWVSVGKDSKRGVDIFSNYLGRGAAVMLTPNGEANNDAIHSSVSTVEMLSNGASDDAASPVMNVYDSGRNSRISAFADMSKSSSSLKGVAKGGGLSVFDNGTEAVAMVADVNGGGNLMSGKSNIFAKDKDGAATIDIDSGSVVIKSNGEEGSITAKKIQASARIKTLGGVHATGDVDALIVNAMKYNNFKGSSMGEIFYSSLDKHLPSLASKAKNLGHSQCILEEHNCWINDEYGNFLRYVGLADEEYNKWGRNDDVYNGRMHDYSIYTYSDDASYKGFSHLTDGSHEGAYALKDKLDRGSFVQHNVADKWNDNRTTMYDFSGQSPTYRREFAKCGNEGNAQDGTDQTPCSWNENHNE